MGVIMLHQIVLVLVLIPHPQMLPLVPPCYPGSPIVSLGSTIANTPASQLKWRPPCKNAGINAVAPRNHPTEGIESCVLCCAVKEGWIGEGCGLFHYSFMCCVVSGKARGGIKQDQTRKPRSRPVCWWYDGINGTDSRRYESKCR